LAVARRIGPTIRGDGLRTAISVVLVLEIVAAMYLAWAHWRTVHLFIYGLDRGLPYPDAAINALERWFDARRPVPPGLLKLHGEFYTVAFYIGTLILILSAAAGLLSGLLANRPHDPKADPRRTHQAN
jgi:hypothetical protein